MKTVHPMDFTGTYPTAWNGYRFKELLGYTTGRHTGVDYNYGTGNQDIGKPIYAIANGRVELVENLTSKGYGNTLIINHGEVYSRYMHAEKYTVKVGDTVKCGQTIGTVGKTGTKWAHLHLDIWKSNLGVHTRYDKDTELQSYEDAYLFIEEHKNDVEDDDMVTPAEIEREYLANRGAKPSQDEINYHMAQGSFKNMSFGFSDENSQRRANYDRTIADLQAALLNEQKKPQRTISELQEQVKQLSAQLAVVGGDTELLNKFGSTLVAVLKRLGLRS